jgi:arylsulfatase A-like enzyme
MFHSGRFNYLGMDALIRRKGFDVTEDAGAIGGQVESSFGVPEAATVTRLLSWIDHDTTTAPFFAAYLPVAGHHPYASATGGPFAPTSEMGRYKNALHDADTSLRGLFDGLRVRGLADRTALVIVGDHGNAGHTLFVYDENVRVPFIVFIPGMTTARRTSSVASLIDVPATIRDLAGTARADDEGISLLSSIPRVAYFFTDYALAWAGLRDGCLKYIEDVATARSKLFDVCNDPHERRDLASQTPLAARYHDRMTALVSD